MGIRTLRPERGRTYHEEGDAGRGDLHLRDARQIHGAFGAGRFGKRARRKDFPRKFIFKRNAYKVKYVKTYSSNY